MFGTYYYVMLSMRIVSKMTQGEVIIEEKGAITGTRILELEEGKVPSLESSYQGTGKILGVEFTNFGTFSGTPRPSGVLYGEGRGIVMTNDGEMVVWSAQGVGKPLGPVAASWRYSIFFQTASEKLGRLNGVLGVGNFDIDENGNVVNTACEWN
jgi:hypothetical protein